MIPSDNDSKTAHPDVPELLGWDLFRYRILLLLFKVIAFAGSRLRNTLAHTLGWCLWHLLSSRRKYTLATVEKHLQCSKSEARRIARASFTENCRSFLEIFDVNFFKPLQSIKIIISEETYSTFLAEERPIVATTAHIGSWELMASLVTDFRPDKYKLVVVRSQKNPVIDRFMKEMRSSRGMLAVGHRQASRLVLEALTKRKAIAAFLVDHNCSQKEAVFLPFLNELAAVNAGPAMLALRSKAAVYPMFLLRLPEGGHAYHIGQPLITSTLEGTIGEKIQKITEFYTRAAEDIVKQYPEQWFWMHKRWKTRPPKDKKK